ncbi:ATP-binding protein [Streptomyces sp. NPDC018019]|uniref:ATP-binding protein n=1 Tax=Streptomyces sp. NPDC018019 TaxID=3365030 RepID=UPI0037BE023C
MGDEEFMTASGEALGGAEGYAPHPHIGGRTAVLRALAAWRMQWPGAPRVVVLTGSPGSGRSHLVAGFLMLCDPEYRKRLPLDDLDPTTVPPDLPAPAVPDPRGLTTDQLLWAIADHYGLRATRSADIVPELAAAPEPLTIVVPDVDRAGPVRAADEPARLVREVLRPLAATGTVQLLADVPRELAAEVIASLPAGQGQVIDLDEPRWADPAGLVLQVETALDPGSGAPALPYTEDPGARRALAEAIAERADGSRLTAQLAVRCILLRPEGFDPADPSLLPGSAGEALDLHARRLGADPQTLRLMLAPLALAEGDGLPIGLWGPLANAVAGRDMGQEIADGMLLAGPFVEPVEVPGAAEAPEGGSAVTGGAAPEGAAGPGGVAPAPSEGATDGGADTGRTLLRLVHPGVADAVRAGLADPRDAQTRIAMALLEAVPQQDWSRADPYVRDHLAAHTLAAGLLPQLLTDPALFAHADPVTLRTAVEAVPYDTLGAPARTYLRTAPLLTRTEAPVVMRAALLETAFVEDGLGPYADALHALGLGLPWRTLWSVPLSGVTGVTVGTLPQAPAGGAAPGPDTAPGSQESGAGAPASAALPVAVVAVPEGTPGSHAVPADAAGAGGSAVLVHQLLGPGYVDTDPALVLRPSADVRAAAPLALSRGADYLRVWDRERRTVVAALISDTPFTGADLSPEGVLAVATARGVKALRIPLPGPAPATSAAAGGTAGAAQAPAAPDAVVPAPAAPSDPVPSADTPAGPHGREGDRS